MIVIPPFNKQILSEKLTMCFRLIAISKHLKEVNMDKSPR